MPRRQETVVLENSSAARYLAIAAKAMTNLGWKIISSTTTEVVAESPMSFGRNTWGELISVYAINKTAEITSTSKGTVLFDWGRNRKNIGYLKSQVEVLQPSWPAEEPLPAEQAEAGAEEQQYVFGRPKEHKNFLHIFIPRGDFFITPLIIELNLAVFIIMVACGVNFFAPEVADLLQWGGNFKPLVLSGQWWRLFTCMFLHSGIIHVAFNMYALFFIGVYLEPLLGRLRFATAYIAAGLLSSLASTWWHTENLVSVGASGAVFGLYGVFLALLTTNIIDKHARQSLMTSVGIFVFYNLFYGFSHKEVDNSAHIGGLLGGLLIGYIYYFSFKEPSSKKNRSVSALVAAGTLIIAALFLTRSKDDNLKFEEKYNAFILLQNEAQGPLQDAANTSDSVLETKLREISLPDWKKAQRVMDSTAAFKLSPAYARKRELTGRYASLRIEHIELIIKAIDESAANPSKYTKQIDEVVKKMEHLVEEINKP